ncbi:hypothetical protein Trydic_g19802 [Trypoxylus dichotomus]
MNAPYCIYPQNITAVTYVLHAIYENYREAEEVPSVIDLSSVVAQVKIEHYIDNLLFSKCIELIVDKLATIIYQDVIKIIRDTWMLKFPKHSLSIFENFLTHAKSSSVVVTSNYILKVWNPLRNNIIGYAVHSSDTSAYDFDVTEIYGNQSSSNINIENVKMGAYIPYEFLTSNTSNYDVKELRVVLLFVLEDRKLRKLLDAPIERFIGFSIPGFCKHNHLPFLSVYDKTTDNWSSFGTDYFDTYGNSPRTCILNKVMYFGKTYDQPFQSRKKEYCLIDTSASSNLPSTVGDTSVLPKYICPDFNCFENPVTSDKTENLYRAYRMRLYNSSYSDILFNSIDNQTSLVDFFIRTATNARNDAVLAVKLFEAVLGAIATQVPNDCPVVAHQYYWRDYDGKIPPDAYNITSNLYITEVLFNSVLIGGYYAGTGAVITEYDSRREIARNTFKCLRFLLSERLPKTRIVRGHDKPPANGQQRQPKMCNLIGNIGLSTDCL